MSVTKKAEKMRLELTGEDKEREKAAAEAKAKEEAEKKAAEEAQKAADDALKAAKELEQATSNDKKDVNSPSEWTVPVQTPKTNVIVKEENPEENAKYLAGAVPEVAAVLLQISA